MKFLIRYHEKVVHYDIPALSKTERGWIKRAIEEKLTAHPEIFAKPLRRSLKGYRSLRVSDYRVIFRIEGSTIFITHIGLRPTAYQQATKRI